MRLRVLVVLVLLAALGCTGPGSPGTRAKLPAARPNIVFLLTDDLDTASISVMPKLRSLLTEQGTTLTDYHVSLSWCCPSRASTLRGQYAHNTRVWSNSPPNGGFYEFHRRGEERSTVATWLRAAGYRTGLFGKYLNGYPEQAPVGIKYVPPGWDTWVAPAGGSPYHQFNYALNVNGKIEKHGRAARDYLTDVLNTKVRKFIAKPGKQPFFAYVAVYNPHSPATPAPRHRHLFADRKVPRTPSFDERDLTGKPTEIRRLRPVTAAETRIWDRLYRRRLQSLQSVDDMIGDLVNTLRATGKLDNTYFVFTSDNGFHIGQHRMAPGKNTAYEEDTRVPFIVRGPGVAAGRQVGLLAGNVDLAPTFADMAGAKAPGFVDGRSLLPLLRPGTPSGWRTAFLLEHGHGPGTRPPLKATDGTLEPPELIPAGQREHFYMAPFEGVHTERYVYVEYSTGERELYDLATDPNELHNLAANQALAAPLAAKLRVLRGCARQTCRSAGG